MSSYWAYLALMFFFLVGLLWSFHGMGTPLVQVTLAIVGSVAYVGLFRAMTFVIEWAARTEMPTRLVCWISFLGLVVLNIYLWFRLVRFL